MNPDNTPTPTPSSYSTPVPAPAPINNETATTYTQTNSDGGYTVYNRFNNQELYTVYSDGSVDLLNGEYDYKAGIGRNEVNVSNLLYDDRTGILTINDSDGKTLFTFREGKLYSAYHYYDTSTRVDIYNKEGHTIGEEIHRDGVIEVYEEGNPNKVKTIFEDGSYEVYEGNNTIQYNKNNSRTKIIFEDGSYETYEGEAIRKFDSDGNEYERLYNDGTKSYVISGEEELIVYQDGTFYDSKTGIKGRYTIDQDGNYKCIDENNNSYIYNKNGYIIESIDNAGNKNNYKYDTMTKASTKNDNTSYSMINHIEYDEETYDKILDTFIKINDNYPTVIQNNISNIANTINSFPDEYNSSSIIEVGNSLITNIEFVDKIKSMTNYSLLAYQTCDENLSSNLNVLIDSLFEDNELDLASKFKEGINSTIEDRDNDSILEYKSDTNFKKIFDELIPTQTYVDGENILYFNNKGNLLSADGDTFHINYGGEDFTLTFGENGCAILKDSNGNPLNIFGDYNLDSKQYGGNQEDFCVGNNAYLLEDENINALLDKFFPNATDEEKLAYLGSIGPHGCGYVAVANIAFKMMEGYEEEFQNNFGYPMYNIVLKDGNVSVDYNYETLTLELYSELNARGRTIQEATEYARGMYSDDMFLEYYLESKYHIYDYNKDSKVIKINAYDNYFMIAEDGSACIGTSGHGIIITEKTEDGKVYISSYGEKYEFRT